MRKGFILTVGILICFCSTSFANLGLEAGFNYNSTTMSNEYTNFSKSGWGLGLHIGGYYNFKFKTGDYIKLSLGLTTRKFKIQDSDYDSSFTYEPTMTDFDIAVLYMKPLKTNPALIFIGGITIVKENDITVKYTFTYDTTVDSGTDSIEKDYLETDIFLTGGIKYKILDNIYPEVKLQYNLTPSRDFGGSDIEFINFFCILFSVAIEFE